MVRIKKKSYSTSPIITSLMQCVQARDRKNSNANNSKNSHKHKILRHNSYHMNVSYVTKKIQKNKNPFLNDCIYFLQVSLGRTLSARNVLTQKKNTKQEIIFLNVLKFIVFF